MLYIEIMQTLSKISLGIVKLVDNNKFSIAHFTFQYCNNNVR